MTIIARHHHNLSEPETPTTQSQNTTEMTRLSFGVSDEVAEEAILHASHDDNDGCNIDHGHPALPQRGNSSITTVKHDNHHHPQNNNNDPTHTTSISMEKEGFHLRHEASLLLNIALPSVAVQLSVLFIFPQTASAVGLRFGTEELAGFSLGSLVGNLTCLSVMVGALTAADTLMPRAMAVRRYPEMGRLAIRGFVMCALLLVLPILPLCTIMEGIFDALGQDPYAASLASKWIQVYLLGVPAMLLFRVIQSFLNAQHQVWPLVAGSTISCFVVHPILLRFFLPSMGFLGSGAAISVTQYVMLGITLVYMVWKPAYKAETWSGLSAGFIKEAIRPLPMLQFLSLSLGGVLSLSVRMLPLL